MVKLRGPKRDAHAKIVATLTGSLETRDHFEVQRLATRLEPRAFGYFVALLQYGSAVDFEVVPYDPGEEERELEWRRQPWAKPTDARGK